MLTLTSDWVRLCNTGRSGTQTEQNDLRAIYSRSKMNYLFWMPHILWLNEGESRDLRLRDTSVLSGKKKWKRAAFGFGFYSSFICNKTRSPCAQSIIRRFRFLSWSSVCNSVRTRRRIQLKLLVTH
ncbi:unnamed protein product [Allacma fusca]|uniref:Uncharacterized protein n=1 Tax=Allacma fusca TaxID=39272 RepID=A0A8J2K1Z1_9HEXA|nr:unnamed protein product [Allacma fusca]